MRACVFNEELTNRNFADNCSNKIICIDVMLKKKIVFKKNYTFDKYSIKN